MEEDAIETQGADMDPKQEEEATGTGYVYKPSAEAIALYELDFVIDWPYPLEVEYMSKVAEVRALWRGGVIDLNKINDEFGAIADEFEKIRRQLIANHEYLLSWYKRMVLDLESKKALVVADRKDFEDEKKIIADLVQMDSEIVSLNVGGTHHMMTETKVLQSCSDSILAKMFSGDHMLKRVGPEDDQKIFLDRDGRTFQHLVNYLRNERQTWPEFVDPNDEVQFLKELDWWKVPTLGGQMR
jgi:hypothetical protein